MAKLRDLTAAVSEALDLPLNPVKEIARRIREAGLITTGTSGRYGGAAMTPKDVARLLVGITGSEEAKDSALTVSRFMATHHRGEAVGHAQEVPRIPEFEQLGEGHNFVDAVEALVASAASGSLLSAFQKSWKTDELYPLEKLSIDVTTRPTLSADVSFFGRFSEAYRWRRYVLIGADEPNKDGLKRTSTVRGDHILRLVRALDKMDQ
jgi:hypothetical protein